jgi:hypothetical protein
MKMVEGDDEEGRQKIDKGTDGNEIINRKRSGGKEKTRIRQEIIQ